MITVRFPSGFSVQYNEANHIEYFTHNGDSIARVKRKSDSAWFADIPLSSGALIENICPCRTYNANKVGDDVLLDAVIERLRHLRQPVKLASLKRELADFDLRRMNWKVSGC